MPGTVNFNCLVLNPHGNQGEHFDDTEYLPPYHVIEPIQEAGPAHSIEITIEAHDHRAWDTASALPFNRVRFTLHGAIKTEIGKHKATQKVSS